ncbi:SirB2 family protein [Aeromonas bestiarum]|uniref:SirB2 family protein n=1 Tax=Aeromonas bestiarum TaxID=105751 RepID=A0ABT7Q1V0_9GAMM|nr:SirB2 family protein [Aeromonas bestiarum]MDM5072876.1 SirB2 family protein [Aeromonas bestiarum]MDM5090752.1 SirB2 family protein [Aeromonas bestiarum]
MIAYYPMLKHLHMTLAIVSLLLFVYRWMLSLNGSPRLQQRWLKIAPHVNDTFLLLFGVLLAVTLHMSPGQQPWLMAKLIALVVYIGLGVMALKRPARNQKLVAGFAALAVFGYMVGAAISKSAWSWLA